MQNTLFAAPWLGVEFEAMTSEKPGLSELLAIGLLSSSPGQTA